MVQRGGYILLDVIAGLMTVGVIMVALTVAVVRQNQVAAKLAESRAGAAVVEEALTRLQLGQLPDIAGNAKLTLRQVDDRPAGGRVWVEVSSKVNGHTVSLTGLIPKQSLAQWQQRVTTRPAGHPDVEVTR